MKKNELRIKYVDIEKLVANPINAKIHTREQIEQIKQSIDEYGFNDPIGVDENYNIIEGHGRYIALKELGVKTAPVIILSGLSQQEIEAYSLVHNQLTNNTGFDWGLLAEELKKITGIDMSKYSFDINIGQYFDEEPDDEGEPTSKRNKGIIKIIAKEQQSNNIRKYLEEQHIEYKEK